MHPVPLFPFVSKTNRRNVLLLFIEHFYLKENAFFKPLKVKWTFLVKRQRDSCWINDSWAKNNGLRNDWICRDHIKAKFDQMLKMFVRPVSFLVVNFEVTAASWWEKTLSNMTKVERTDFWKCCLPSFMPFHSPHLWKNFNGKIPRQAF